MKVLLLGATLLLALATVPITASAHTVICDVDDARCVVQCMRHSLEAGDHDCALRAPERCPSGSVGVPPICVPIE